MGAKSTVEIRRDHAVEIIQYLLTIASDEGIADALEALVDESPASAHALSLSNFSINPEADEGICYWTLLAARRHKEDSE